MGKITTGFEPAMPTGRVITDHYGNFEGIMDKHWPGLTIRQHFAIMAMQGICANPNSPHWDAERIAEYSVKYADALIAELNKPANPNL